MKTILSRLSGVKKTSSGYIAKCPAHEDKTPSLSISLGDDGRTLLKCFAGCQVNDICGALGITTADLFQHGRPDGDEWEVIAEYIYNSETGAPLFKIDRTRGKQFPQYRPDGKGGWAKGTKGVRKVLFRLPEIMEAVASGFPIIVTEGEKDALALVERGFHATTNPGGACNSESKWIDEYSETLRGAAVVISGDNDSTGKKHVEVVAKKLKGVAASVKAIFMPEGRGKDVADFFRLGGTPDEFVELIDATGEWVPAPPLQARPLWDLQRRQENDPTELLRHNYLSIGGSLLAVAPSGVGKSALESQCGIAWAAGLSTVGIAPARPLKSLIIQAEDDDGDRAEMRDGIIEGLNLTPSQIALAKQNVFIHHESTHTGQSFFIDVVQPLLALHRPDLLWINPFFAFLGGDVSDQPLVSKFTRNWLNPLLIQYQCAAIIIHHTNKPPSGREKPNWSAGDFAYLGSGSVELTNWARAVLAIRSIGSHDVFSLYAGKRGKRLRWTNDDGSPTMQRLIGHSDKAGIIYWRDVDESEFSKPKATADAILALVPRDGRIERAKLQMEAQAAGMGRDKARLMIDELLDTQRLFESKEKRSGGRDRIFISRYQP